MNVNSTAAVNLQQAKNMKRFIGVLNHDIMYYNANGSVISKPNLLKQKNCKMSMYL